MADFGINFQEAFSEPIILAKKAQLDDKFPDLSEIHSIYFFKFFKGMPKNCF